MPDARLHVMDHPLILHKISLLRDKETNTKDFRQLIYEIALLIGCEATRDLPVTECAVSTPVAEAVGYRLPRQVCLVPILRAGLGMVDALLNLLPAAKVGHIGLARDPATLAPVEYYCRLPPDVAGSRDSPMCPIFAAGMRVSSGSTMPSPARRIGTRHTWCRRRYPTASAMGVVTGHSVTGRSRVASQPISRAISLMSSRKSFVFVSFDRSMEILCRIRG